MLMLLMMMMMMMMMMILLTMMMMMLHLYVPAFLDSVSLPSASPSFAGLKRLRPNTAPPSRRHLPPASPGLPFAGRQGLNRGNFP
jgi:hypothetical protein